MILCDRPKLTAGCSANGIRRRNCFSDQSHKLFSAFELTVFVLVKKNGIHTTDFSVTIIKFHQNTLKRFINETCGHTKIYNQPHQYLSIFLCKECTWDGLRGHNIDTWFHGCGILFGDTN